MRNYIRRTMGTLAGTVATLMLLQACSTQSPTPMPDNIVTGQPRTEVAGLPMYSTPQTPNSAAEPNGNNTSIRPDGKGGDVSGLRRLSGKEELRNILKNMGLFYSDTGATDGGITKSSPGRATNSATPAEAPDMAAETPMASPESAPQGAGYSETNTQVKGIDESDVVKTDGTYIYTLSNNRLAIVKAYPSESMSRTALINLQEHMSWASNIYVSGNYLVVEGTSEAYPADTSGNPGVKPTDPGNPELYNKIAPDAPVASILPYPIYKTFTRFVVFDITDKANPKSVRTVDSDGYLISSRLAGGRLYYVTNSWINSIPEKSDDDFHILPAYRDTLKGDETYLVPAEDIIYCPGNTSSYTLAGSFALNDTEPSTPEAFLGAGQNLYMSENALYIVAAAADDYNSTSIYRLAISDDKLTYTGSARVKGSILNQYSMDEFNGSFRIATTNYGDEKGMSNAVYILDTETMKVTGEVTGLALGERIYSVRFMGNTGYVVTFQQTDPLFVIDLSDKTAPKVLGELKIPGFSQYLHPFGDGYVIGFGVDTRETYVRDDSGNEVVVGIYQGGVKLSIFDVRDPQNPKEVQKLVIGGQGTWSEVQNNPRALMVDAERGLFGFPISISDYKMNGAGESYSAIMLINADPENGLSIAQSFRNDEFSYGARVLYIRDRLYTISNQNISAYDYNTFAKAGNAAGIYN